MLVKSAEQKILSVVLKNRYFLMRNVALESEVNANANAAALTVRQRDRF